MKIKITLREVTEYGPARDDEPGVVVELTPKEEKKWQRIAADYLEMQYRLEYLYDTERQKTGNITNLTDLSDMTDTELASERSYEGDL